MNPQGTGWKVIRNPKIKKVIGVVLIVLGVLVHFIPFVPAGWIILIGLELLGVRLLFWDKIRKSWRERMGAGSGNALNEKSA